jgi:hypothetical protein
MDDAPHRDPDDPPALHDPRGIPVDDPEGGRRLTRALLRWLPVAALAGALLGIPLALLGDDWRAVPTAAAVAVAITGGILAAVEDGRVQRDLARRRALGGPPGGGAPPRI